MTEKRKMLWLLGQPSEKQLMPLCKMFEDPFNLVVKAPIWQATESEDRDYEVNLRTWRALADEYDGGEDMVIFGNFPTVAMESLPVGDTPPGEYDSGMRTLTLLSPVEDDEGRFLRWSYVVVGKWWWGDLDR